MKKKIIRKIILILIIMSIILGIIIFIKGQTKVDEIIPESEINEDVNQTLISLYYENQQNGELESEARLVELKKIMDNPYEEIINMLMKEPENKNLKSAIPKDTYLYNVSLDGNILNIDFSKEFIDNNLGGEKNEKNSIYAIVNTMCQLKEIDGIKILIEGKNDQQFKDNEVNLSDTYMCIK